MLNVSGRLAAFRNQDDVELAGFAIGPMHPRSGLGALYLHGKGGNFYTGPGRFLSIGLADQDCLHLSMNMRCHDIGYTRYDMESPDISVGGALCDGGAWERTAEGWKDIDAGITYLLQQGCSRVVLAGHSSGGLYAGVYEDSRDVVVGRVFLSPLLTSRTAFRVWFQSQEERDEARARAEEMVAAGLGERLMPLPVWYNAISARALLERIAEPDDYFENGLRAWMSPVLAVWGEAESRVADWKGVFGSLRDRPCRMVGIPGAGHHYTGSEDLVIQAVRDFLTGLGAETAA